MQATPSADWIEKFIRQEEQKQAKTRQEQEIVLDEQEGLVERESRKIITAKGKQLLREVY